MFQGFPIAAVLRAHRSGGGWREDQLTGVVGALAIALLLLFAPTLLGICQTLRSRRSSSRQRSG
jgi:hypothetical protein